MNESSTDMSADLPTIELDGQSVTFTPGETI